MEGYKHTLSIRDCTVEDSGQYAFHAGKVKSEAKLDVQGTRRITNCSPLINVAFSKIVIVGLITGFVRYKGAYTVYLLYVNIQFSHSDMDLYIADLDK